MPISPDEFLENARRSGRFSCAGIAAGVVRKKKWAELACAEIITTPVFSGFERALAHLKKNASRDNLPHIFPSRENKGV